MEAAIVSMYNVEGKQKRVMLQGVAESPAAQHKMILPQRKY